MVPSPDGGMAGSAMLPDGEPVRLNRSQVCVGPASCCGASCLPPVFLLAAVKGGAGGCCERRSVVSRSRVCMLALFAAANLNRRCLA